MRKGEIAMRIQSGKCDPAKSVIVKRLLLICFLTIMVVCFTSCGLVEERDERTFSLIAEMYEELEDLSDAEMIRYNDGNLYAIDFHGTQTMLQKELYPCSFAALKQRRVLYVSKIGDDIFFILQGILDNYSGYVLSKDTSIDMQLIKGIERELTPVTPGLVCFRFFSV